MSKPVIASVVEKLSRRKLLTTTVTVAGVSLIPSWVSAEEATSDLSTDPRRPQFHLLPAKNWMNDPNGPVYFKGKYHMFCQFNPLAAVWGDMSWYHSESSDMLHWNHKPLAMTPTEGGPDAYGCFSGSAIKVGSRVYQIYTGTRLSTPDLATIRDGENKIQESQCIAWSDDSLLIKWTKQADPIIPLPPPGMKITGFRDPSAWKQEDWYYMTVGSGEAEVGGCVLLYRTKDLADPKAWEYMHKLTSGTWTGKKTANPCDDNEMWECPDFFALDGGHLLIYSTLGKVIWESGHLDPVTMKFTKNKTGELDLGAFYAPKTQLDGKGRRILWGWIQEKRSEAEMKVAGWSGIMSLPRVLTLDKDGTLRVKALPETMKLRGGELAPEEARAGVVRTIPKATGEVFCKGTRSGPWQLTMHHGQVELLHATYNSDTHEFVVDGKEIVLTPEDIPSLHAYIDGSVIELIVSERIGYTKRFYYPGTVAPDVEVRASGTGDLKLNAWKILPISKDRLTTPQLATAMV
jgi:beta-fructofuranosidase